MRLVPSSILTLRNFALHLSLLALAAGPAQTSLIRDASAAEWADLQITFVYDSDKLPEVAEVNMAKDPGCVALWAGQKPMSEDLIIDATSKGIKNIVLFPDSKKSGLEPSDIHPDLKEPPVAATILDNVKCVFEPHIVIVRPKQTLTVKNSDNMGHNALFNLFVNAGINPLIPSGGSKDVKFDKAEKAPIPVQCNIHPWMTAYMLLFDNPYASVSDAKGVLKIEKLPAGKPITFKIWHEKADKSIDSVTFDGKEVEWKKGNVELTLKPGMNDLGIVKIKPDEFKK